MFAAGVLLALCDLAHAQMAVDIVHAFQIPGSIGPKASLITASDGNFYGVTERGGLDECGTIFRMTPSGTVTAIHSFNCIEGRGPFQSLVQAHDGYLYGTALLQNDVAGGIAFRTTLDGAFEVIHVFTQTPTTALVEGSDGNLYGGTMYSGSLPGAIFRMTRSGDVVELRKFDVGGPTLLIAGPGGAMFGVLAQGSLIASTVLFSLTVDGSFTHLYEVTWSGCQPFICPRPPVGFRTVALVATPTALYGVDETERAFRLDASGVTVLHEFAFDDPAGARPLGLTRGLDGNFYGVTSTWSEFGSGSLFRMTPDGAVTVLHAFDPPIDGARPAGSLVQAADGTLVGLTQETTEAGELFTGTAFTMSMSGDFSIRHRFADVDLAAPNYLIRTSDGTLYGTTARGGAQNSGVLFRLPSAGTPDVLHEFPFLADQWGHRSRLPGVDLAPTLMEAADGTFYATTFAASYLFRATATGEVVQTVGFTSGPPAAPVIQGSDGAVYGTTVFCCFRGGGTVYRFAAGEEALTTLHVFDRNTEGAGIAAAVVEATDGSLYGTAAEGGSGNLGTIFRMTIDGSVTMMHSFGGAADGARPLAPLIRATDGNFYGTTFEGGPADLGTVFRLTPTGTFEVLHTFTGADGANPTAALLQAADGYLYGVTQGGGAHGRGAVFRLTIAGVFTLMHSFSGTDGERPSRRLIQGTDGFLYGTAERGGPGGGGVIFRLVDVSCENTLTLSYTDGTLDMEFHLRSVVPSIWSVWLVTATAVLPMWSLPIPAVTPPASINKPIPQFPHIGFVGVLTILANPTVQSQCGDWRIVDTGR